LGSFKKWCSGLIGNGKKVVEPRQGQMRILNPKDLVKQKQVKPESLFICGKGEKVVCGDWSKCRLDQMLLQTVVI
jgi:hypothetical protein